MTLRLTKTTIKKAYRKAGLTCGLVWDYCGPDRYGKPCLALVHAQARDFGLFLVEMSRLPEADSRDAFLATLLGESVQTHCYGPVSVYYWPNIDGTKLED